MPFLDVEKLKSSKNQKDIKAALEAVKKDNGYLFQDVTIPRVASLRDLAGKRQMTQGHKQTMPEKHLRQRIRGKQYMAVHITSRADAEAIIREQVISTIFQDAPKQSTFLSMARKCRT